MRAWREERAALEAQGIAIGPWVKQMAMLCGVSVHTVYRQSAPAVRARKERSDAGALKVMDETSFWEAAALVAKKDIDAEMALDIISHNRVLRGEPALDIHPETFRRHLREHGVSRKHNARDLRIHRRWEAPYPGYLWQVDATVSSSYYLGAGMSVEYEPTMNRYKNKPGNQRPRISLITVIDDHSRVTWGKYLASANAIAWRHVLLAAMEKGHFADPNFWPAYGVPERVYADQGSEIKSGIMTRTLSALGAECDLHRPSTEHEKQSQATGKVERAGGKILHGFEKNTRGDRFDSLDEMNEALVEYLLRINSIRHSSTGAVPFERWLTAPEVRLLPPGEVLRLTSYREDTRVISSNLTIQLNGKSYALEHREPFINCVGRKLPILYLEADLSKISLIIDGQEHEIPVLEAFPDVAGEFHASPVPEAVQRKRELLSRDLSHLDIHGVHKYRNDRDGRGEYPIRPREVEHPLTLAALAPQMVRRGKAVTRFQVAGLVAVPPSPEQQADLDALFAGRAELPEPELVAWIDTHRGSGSTPQLRVMDA